MVTAGFAMKVLRSLGERERLDGYGSMTVEKCNASVIPNLQIDLLISTKLAWHGYHGYFCFMTRTSTTPLKWSEEQLQFLARASQLGRQALSRLSLHKDKAWKKTHVFFRRFQKVFHSG